MHMKKVGLTDCSWNVGSNYRLPNWGRSSLTIIGQRSAITPLQTSLCQFCKTGKLLLKRKKW